MLGGDARWASWGGGGAVHGAEGVRSTEQRPCGPWSVGVEVRGVRGMRSVERITFVAGSLGVLEIRLRTMCFGATSSAYALCASAREEVESKK